MYSSFNYPEDGDNKLLSKLPSNYHHIPEDSNLPYFGTYLVQMVFTVEIVDLVIELVLCQILHPRALKLKFGG
jgi:hypothetical protein